MKFEETKIQITHEILADLHRHSLEPNEEYLNNTFDFALKIYAVSPKAYSILADELFFPCSKAIQYIFSKSISKFPEDFVNVEHFNGLVSQYHEMTPISKSNTIYTYLSGDTIYFTPDVAISDEDVVSGINLIIHIGFIMPQNVFKILSNDMKSFDHFLQLQSENIIKQDFYFKPNLMTQLIDHLLSIFCYHRMENLMKMLLISCTSFEQWSTICCPYFADRVTDS